MGALLTINLAPYTGDFEKEQEKNFMETFYQNVLQAAELARAREDLDYTVSVFQKVDR